MPAYLCHGFRWQRRSIRVYVIVQNLDDASPEWIIPARSSQCILRSFYSLFDFLPYCIPATAGYTPSHDVDSDDGSYVYNNDYTTSDSPRNRSRSRGRSRSQSRTRAHAQTHSRNQSRIKQEQPLPPLPNDPSRSATPEDDFSSQSWSAIKLLEEYDPHDLTAVSRPYAYVADYAVRIDLSCSIAEEIARYEQQQQHFLLQTQQKGEQPVFLEKLRDQLQRGEEIRWYVVINDDEVRGWPSDGSPGPVSRPAAGHQPAPPQYYYPPGRPPPSREQLEHHAQYLLQQRIFEGDDRQRQWEQKRREQRERERSVEPSWGRRPDENMECNPPVVPEKDHLPPRQGSKAVAALPLRSKMSFDAGNGRPKTAASKGAGLRRLFGRSKAVEGASPAG